ncbi:trypsin 3A1-like [Haematobia irritans]|uniref:trypsin 3A1-like n=1 Tax=Haematobia irritans TaxID=7368 RepID=UPI003F4FAF27
MIIRYLLIVTLTLYFAITLSAGLRRSPRIVGGTKIQEENIPYIVNIRRNGSFHCGGSLVTPKCVLTAAHCVYKSKPKDLIVQGGVTLLHDQRNKISVKSIILSPQFNVKTIDHDWAILKLKHRLHGWNIHTIQLSNYSPQNGDFVRVSGWGLTQENGDVSNHLRSVYLKVISQEMCKKFYRDYRNITKTMFCAFIPGLKDACLGDSGGPAVIDNQIVGIVSWGRRGECARFNSPGVYVNIKMARPWLRNVISQHCY